MDLTFDHLGVVTADLSRGRAFLSGAFGISRWTREIRDPGIGVVVQFGKAEDGDGPWYELITPLGEHSPVSETLASGKNVLNHVAYLVSDIGATANNLREQRCFPVAPPQPAVAYGGKKVQFFISPLKFMIELIEAAGHQHKVEESELDGKLVELCI